MTNRSMRSLYASLVEEIPDDDQPFDHDWWMHQMTESTLRYLVKSSGKTEDEVLAAADRVVDGSADGMSADPRARRAHREGVRALRDFARAHRGARS